MDKIKINSFSSEKIWDYENAYYWFSDNSRLLKILAHFQLFKKTIGVEGDILEFGVCKGSSLIRTLTFLKNLKSTKKIYGFDTFSLFPSKNLSLLSDKKFAKKFNINSKAISKKKLEKILKYKNFKNYELIEGNVFSTLEPFLKKHSNKKFSSILMDLDVMEPTLFVLERVFPLLQKKGIIILDNFNVIKGETKAIKLFIKKYKLSLLKVNFSKNFYYLVK